MSDKSIYEYKYLKYKIKYLELLNSLGLEDNDIYGGKKEKEKEEKNCDKDNKFTWLVDTNDNVILSKFEHIVVLKDRIRKPEIKITKYRLCKWSTLNEKKQFKENGIEINLLEDELLNIKFSKKYIIGVVSEYGTYVSTKFTTSTNIEFIVGKDTSKCKEIVEKK